MKILTKKSLLVGLSSVFLMSLSSVGLGAFKLEMTDVGAAVTKTITDNGAQDDNGVMGIINYSTFGTGTTVGTYTVIDEVGRSKPVSPSPQLDLIQLELTGGTGEFIVKLTDTDFMSAKDITSMFGSIGGDIADGIVKIDYFLDPSNVEFGTAIPLDLGGSPHLGSFGPNIASYSDDKSRSFFPPILAGTKFSMTMIASITHTSASDRTKFTAVLRAADTPKMGGLLTAALGLPLIGWLAWRRKSTKTINASFA